MNRPNGFQNQQFKIVRFPKTTPEWLIEELTTLWQDHFDIATEKQQPGKK